MDGVHVLAEHYEVSNVAGFIMSVLIIISVISLAYIVYPSSRTGRLISICVLLIAICCFVGVIMYMPKEHHVKAIVDDFVTYHDLCSVYKVDKVDGKLFMLIERED